jgi:hypothetical protein
MELATATVKPQSLSEVVGIESDSTLGIQMSPHHSHSGEGRRRQANVVLFLVLVLAMAMAAISAIVIRADSRSAPPDAAMPLTNAIPQ